MDRSLRERVRRARESGDSAAALDAAHALARVGERDAAAALARAAFTTAATLDRADADFREAVHALHQRLEPSHVSALLDDASRRLLGARFGLPRIRQLAWSPDGDSIYAAAGRHEFALHAIDARTGAARLLAELPGYCRGLSTAPGGRIATCCTSRDLARSEVALFDGALRDPVARPSDWLRRIDLDAWPGRVVAFTSHGVRAYATDRKRRALWAVKGLATAAGMVGTVVVLRSDSVRIYDAGATKPRAEVELETACPFWRGGYAPSPPEVFAAGRAGRVLYRGFASGARVRRAHAAEARWQVATIGPAGEPLERRLLPALPSIQGWVPSPTGRFVLALHASSGREQAQTTRSRQATLLDVEAGSGACLELPALPSACAWSPSGRSLAIGTDEGTVLVLAAADAGATQRPAPASAPRPEPGWVELFRVQRFWRARVTPSGDRLEVRYGIRGAQGRAHTIETDAPAQELERRVREKERAGYAPEP